MNGVPVPADEPNEARSQTKAYNDVDIESRPRADPHGSREAREPRSRRGPSGHGRGEPVENLAACGRTVSSPWRRKGTVAAKLS